MLNTISSDQLARGEQLLPSFSRVLVLLTGPSLSLHTECPWLRLPSLRAFDAFLHHPHSRSDTSPALGAASSSRRFLAPSWLEGHRLPSGILTGVTILCHGAASILINSIVPLPSIQQSQGRIPPSPQPSRYLFNQVSSSA